MCLRNAAVSGVELGDDVSESLLKAIDLRKGFSATQEAIWSF
jgi:hypothetical protein